jgi:hypothetical protein
VNDSVKVDMHDTGGWTSGLATYGWTCGLFNAVAGKNYEVEFANTMTSGTICIFDGGLISNNATFLAHLNDTGTQVGVNVNSLGNWGSGDYNYYVGTEYVKNTNPPNPKYDCQAKVTGMPSPIGLHKFKFFMNDTIGWNVTSELAFNVTSYAGSAKLNAWSINPCFVRYPPSHPVGLVSWKNGTNVTLFVNVSGLRVGVDYPTMNYRILWYDNSPYQWDSNWSGSNITSWGFGSSSWGFLEDFSVVRNWFEINFTRQVTTPITNGKVTLMLKSPLNETVTNTSWQFSVNAFGGVDRGDCKTLSTDAIPAPVNSTTSDIKNAFNDLAGSLGLLKTGLWVVLMVVVALIIIYAMKAELMMAFGVMVLAEVLMLFVGMFFNFIGLNVVVVVGILLLAAGVMFFGVVRSKR